LDALRWASEGGVNVLRRPELGRIVEGMQAGLALFKLDELRFSGNSDSLAALVICGAHQADRVMVAGKWIVEDGQILGLDLKQLQAQHHREAKRLQEKLHQLSIKPNNELTDKFIKSCHSGISVAKTRNPNELKGIIEKYCHSGRSGAKTRNPGVLFKILSLSLAV